MRKEILSWLLAIALSGTGTALAAEGCTVNKVLGDVQVLRNGQKMPAKENDLLKKGDSLQTGPSCTADMSMNDMAGCRVLPKSQVNVMSWKPENMALSVQEGNVILRVKILSPDSSFKVETPTAVATVRGTQFWGRVENTVPDNPVTTFAVRKGSVEILDKASSQTFQVRTGQALDVPKTHKESPYVRAAVAEELAAMEQAEAIPAEAG